MVHDILNVAVFQLDLIWENPAANRAKIDEWLIEMKIRPDIVFLPEMFSTGFSMRADFFAESMEGETLSWMKKRSNEYQLALCGSLAIRDGEMFYNRLLFVEPNGIVHFYDKRHLFKMGNEHLNYQSGSERLIITYKGWRICPLICYDLRFPVWSRNRNEYDILVYSANWPQSRNDVWNTLLKARAIENQSYVVGINRVGIDGAAINYSGNSLLIDPRGHILGQTNDNVEDIICCNFSYNKLVKFRTNFPVLNDADSFLIC